MAVGIGGGGGTCRIRSSRCCQKGGAWEVWGLGHELLQRCMGMCGVRQSKVLSNCHKNHAR
jgi:hypothetical protein